MNISIFSGFEKNMSNVFQVLNSLRAELVNNQQIIFKQNVVQLNLILKIQEILRPVYDDWSEIDQRI
jgi:hypothetical protein